MSKWNERLDCHRETYLESDVDKPLRVVVIVVIIKAAHLVVVFKPLRVGEYNYERRINKLRYEKYL